MNKNLDVVEDIKRNIRDNQYKTIMESLMEINKIHNYMEIKNVINSCVCSIGQIQNQK